MNNNKKLPFAYSAEDISRINAINLKDPHSVSAINAINISTTENKTNPHDGSTLDSFLLEEAELKIKNLEEELAKWKACADRLFAYADEVKCGTHNRALWEAACQDIEEYKKLKELPDEN